jgi:hypothetical protein
MGSILTRRTFLERAACAGAVLSMTRSLAAQSGMYISRESHYSSRATDCSGPYRSGFCYRLLVINKYKPGLFIFYRQKC